MAEGAGGPPNQESINEGFGKEISDLKGAVSSLADNVNRFVGGLESASTPVKNLARDFDTVGLRLKAMVDYVGDYNDSMKELRDIQRTISTTGIYSSKNYGEAKRRLEQLAEAQNVLINKSPFAGKELREQQAGLESTRRALMQLETGMKKAGKAYTDGMDPDSMISINRELRSAITNVQQFEKAWKTVKLGPVTRGVMSINTALGRSGYVEKFAKYGQISHEIDEARKARQAGGAQEFEQKRANILKTMGAKGRGLKMNIPLDEKGNFDVQKFMKQRQKGKRKPENLRALGGEEAGDIAGQLSGKKGVYGKIDRWLGGKVLSNLQGGNTGMLTKIGGKLMKAGGGSITEGAVGAVAGGGEGLMSGASGLLGRAAIPLAIASVIKDIFDKGANMNKEVNNTLGGAGIYSGGEKGQQALQNVRTNLTPGGFSAAFNPLGVSYEKNLKIAQTVAESGTNLSELATGGGKQGNLYMGGAFGGVQQMAYGGNAKTIGLDEVGATREILKMLQVYHTSLEQTDDFFNKVASDLKASGITQGKYFQTISAITDEFGKWGKSLDQVVSTMRLLGRSGRETADDLKESMDALTNQGQQRSYETSAFLTSEQIRQHPEAIQNLAEAQKGSVETQRNATIDALKKAGVDTTGLNLTSMEGIRAAQQRLSDTTQGRQGGGPGGLASQTAGGNLRQLITDTQRLQMTQNLLSNRTPEGALQYETGMRTLGGKGFAGQATQQIGTLQELLAQGNQGKGYSLKDLFGKNATMVKSDPLLMKLQETLQTDPQFLDKITEVMGGAATATLQEATKGTLSDKSYQKLAEVAGLKPEKGQSAKNQVMQYVGTQQNREKLYSQLAETPDNLMDVVNNTSDLAKKVNEAAATGDKTKKAEEIVGATRPTAEIFADAFTNLFNQLTRPLTSIAGYIEDWSKHWPFKSTGDVGQDQASDAAVKAGQALASGSDFQSNVEDIGVTAGKLDDKIAMLNATGNDADKKQAEALSVQKDHLYAVQQAGLAAKTELDSGKAMTNDRLDADNYQVNLLRTIADGIGKQGGAEARANQIIQQTTGAGGAAAGAKTTNITVSTVGLNAAQTVLPDPNASSAHSGESSPAVATPAFKGKSGGSAFISGKPN